MQQLRKLHADGKLDALQEMLLFAPRRPAEGLYDLAADPHELSNLAGDPKFKQPLHELRKRLDDWEEATGDKGRTPEPMAMYDSDMKVYLSALKGEKREELLRNIKLNKEWASHEGK